jgi:hypothetical protein
MRLLLLLRLVLGASGYILSVTQFLVEPESSPGSFLTFDGDSGIVFKTVDMTPGQLLSVVKGQNDDTNLFAHVRFSLSPSSNPCVGMGNTGTLLQQECSHNSSSFKLLLINEKKTKASLRYEPLSKDFDETLHWDNIKHQCFQAAIFHINSNSLIAFDKITKRSYALHVGDIKNLDHPDYNSSQWIEKKKRFIRDGLWSFEAAQYAIPRSTKITVGAAVVIGGVAAAYSSLRNSEPAPPSTDPKIMENKLNSTSSKVLAALTAPFVSITDFFKTAEKFYGYKEKLNKGYRVIQYADTQISFMFHLDQFNIKCHRGHTRQDAITIDDDTFLIIIRTFQVKADVPLSGKNIEEAMTSWSNIMAIQAAT